MTTLSIDVSVIVPVYNGEKYVAEAVESAASQPEVLEVLLVDDGSTDGTLEVCEELAKRVPKVRLFRHAAGKNLGVSESRNLAIRNAKGTFISFLDSDDVYLPGRFQPLRCALEQHPDLDGVYDAVGVTFQTAEAEARWQKLGRELLTTINKPLEPEQVFETLFTGQRGRFHTDGIVLRRSLVVRTGMFHPRLKIGEDTHLWIRAAACGELRAGQLKEPVALRRVHDTNTFAGKPPPQHEWYRNRWAVYLLVLDWLVKNRCRKEAWPSVVERLLHCWDSSRNPHEVIVTRMVAEIGMLGVQVIRRPWLFRLQPFRRRLRQVVTKKRLRRVARECVGRWPALDVALRRMAGRSSSTTHVASDKSEGDIK